MLTARGRRTITLGLIAGAAGRILGIPDLFGLATAVVVVVLAALVRVRMTKGTVTVAARAVPPVVNAGEPAVFELTIEESGLSGWRSAPIALLTDHSQGSGLRQPAKIIVQRLARGDRAQATFGLLTERRGPVDAGAYEATISDPLGLARRRLSVSRPARCIALPHIEPLTTVVPEVPGRLAAESTLSVAERLITGSSMLRRYAQGDDFRRVHWRTTARVGELMVRDGGDRDEPDRIATTVLLDVGDDATPVDELDRAVEVAASVLSLAADGSSTGAAGAYRLLTTTNLTPVVNGGEKVSRTCSSPSPASLQCPHRRASGSAPPSRGSAGPTETRCSSSSALSGSAHRIQRFSRISPGRTRRWCSSSWAPHCRPRETSLRPGGRPTASQVRLPSPRPGPVIRKGVSEDPDPGC